MLTPLAPFDADAILSLEDARTQLRLTEDDTFHEPRLIAARKSAIAWTERFTKLSLQERQWQWTTDYFTSRIALPIGPVTAIDGISYYDRDGVDTDLVEADWYFGNNVIVAATGTAWPYANGFPGGVRVTFTAGYATADDIDGDLLEVVKLAMSAFFENSTAPDMAGAIRQANLIRVPSL